MPKFTRRRKEFVIDTQNLKLGDSITLGGNDFDCTEIRQEVKTFLGIPYSKKKPVIILKLSRKNGSN